MCQPLVFNGENLRRENADEKLLRLANNMRSATETGISGNTDQWKEDTHVNEQASGGS